MDNMTTYDVKCPKCRKKAAMQMRPDGIRGTYREPVSKMVPEKLTCASCGYVSESHSMKINEYELWYKSTFQDHVIWAHNRKHLCFLINWLSGDFDKGELNTSEKAYVENLPKWMISNKNRSRIVHRFKRMINNE